MFKNWMNKSYALEIHFSKETIIKGFYTAWNVGELSFGLEENDEPWKVNDSNGKSWNFNYSTGNTFPRSFALPKAFVAKRLNLTITHNENQALPIFDIRGCSVKINDDDNVNITHNGRVIEIVETNSTVITSYNDANKFCMGKGGHLVVPHSSEVVEVIMKVVKGHAEKFSDKRTRYLIGLRKEGELWKYANNKTLGRYQNWGPGYPSINKSCIALQIANVSNVTLEDVKWITWVCDNLDSNLRPICEYPQDGYNISHTHGKYSPDVGAALVLLKGIFI